MATTVQRQISYVPANDSVINGQDTANIENVIANALPNINQDNLTISPTYQRFLTSIRTQVNDIVSRGFDTLTLNPDFNWARTGTAPVTQADGDDVSFNEQWYVSGATGNTYTITPTAYPDDAKTTPTGSQHYMNVDITNLTNPLTLYNVNYNTDFNSAQSLQNKSVVFSTFLKSNTDDPLAMQFAITLEGGPTFSSKVTNLKPGINLLAFPQIDIPSYSGLSLPTNCFAQLNLKFIPGVASSGNVDISYIKAEISGLATNLTVNHIAQKLLIDGLNA